MNFHTKLDHFIKVMRRNIRIKINRRSSPQILYLSHLFIKMVLDQYEEKLNMLVFTPLEENAMRIAAKANCRDNIVYLLEIRFNSVPKSLEKSLKKIDTIFRLKQLIAATISVNSLTEFQELINFHLNKIS